MKFSANGAMDIGVMILSWRSEEEPQTSRGEVMETVPTGKDMLVGVEVSTEERAISKRIYGERIELNVKRK